MNDIIFMRNFVRGKRETESEIVDMIMSNGRSGMVAPQPWCEVQFVSSVDC